MSARLLFLFTMFVSKKENKGSKVRNYVEQKPRIKIIPWHQKTKNQFLRVNFA